MESNKDDHNLFIEEKWSTWLPIVAGVFFLTFFTVKLFNGKNFLFWALSTSYLVFGAFISYGKTSICSLKFEKANIIICLVLIIGSVGAISFNFDWGMEIPILIVSIIVLIFSLHGINIKYNFYYAGYSYCFGCYYDSVFHLKHAYHNDKKNERKREKVKK